MLIDIVQRYDLDIDSVSNADLALLHSLLVKAGQPMVAQTAYVLTDLRSRA